MTANEENTVTESTLTLTLTQAAILFGLAAAAADRGLVEQETLLLLAGFLDEHRPGQRNGYPPAVEHADRTWLASHGGRAAAAGDR